LTYKKYYFEKSGDQRPLKKRGEIRKAIRVGEFIIKKMIKLNEQYSINNGQGSIVFSEGNNGTVNALYTISGNKSEGKINGTLDGNILKGTFHVDAAAGLIEFTFSEDGFEAKWKQGIEPGPMRGKWEGNIGVDYSSEKQEENTNQKVHLIKFYLGCDDEGNDITLDNAPDIIYEKIMMINSFLKDKIDAEVSGFLHEEFLGSFTSIENKSINSTDLLDFIKNKLKSDLMRAAFESGDTEIRVVFIFDPKENELEVWHNEFPELSEHFYDSYQVYGYHSKFEDIVCQEYADGDYLSGIIYAKINDEPISSYLKNEDDVDYFPQDSIFEKSNY